MRRLWHRQSFHAKLTITIASTLMGSIILTILVVWFVFTSQGLGATVFMASTEMVAADGTPSTTVLTVADGSLQGQPLDAAGDGTWEVSAQEPTSGTDTLITFGDGTPIPRDLIVYAALILATYAILAIAVGSATSRNVTRRIRTITAHARAYAEGAPRQMLEPDAPNDEIRDLSETLTFMLDRIEDTLSSQKQFIANASHELRTPIAVCRTVLQIPLAQGRVPQDLIAPIEDALQATKRSEDLIAALFELASCSQDLDLHDGVDLSALIHGVIRETATEANEQHIHVTAELDDGLAAVRGSATLLASTMRNIVVNAIRHNITNGTVEVRLEDRGEGAVITVENSGQHVSATDLARLAEPFFRGSQNRLATGGARGAGLGLSIATKVFAVHGWTLALSARDEGGLRAEIQVRTHEDGHALAQSTHRSETPGQGRAA